MRKDSLLYLTLIVIYVIMAIKLCSVSFAAAEATIRVDPSTVYGLPGESVTIDIKIADVVNLYGWQVNMTFNPSVVEVVNVTEGDFLQGQPEGTSGESKIENEAGWATFSWLTVGKYNGVDGSGTLATVEFQTLTRGESILNINRTTTYLLEMIPPPPPPGEPPYREIPSIKENGFFTSLIAPPVVEFTCSPKRPPKNELVAFDASASYDDEEIVSYEWDFGDGTTEIYIGANLTAITTHQYTTSGSKKVTLNVTDNLGLWTMATSDIWVRFTHDVAVTDVQVSQVEVTAGENVSIGVTVTNLGEEAELVSVAVYYDETEIGIETTDLEPDENGTLTFSWDTAVAPADYSIRAEADVDGEEHAGDNVMSGGTVTVNPAGQPFPTTLIIAVVVIIVIVVGVGAFLYMRKGASPT